MNEAVVEMRVSGLKLAGGSGNEVRLDAERIAVDACLKEADMRITVTVDHALLVVAEEATGITNRSLLVQQALLALVQRETLARPAALIAPPSIHVAFDVHSNWRRATGSRGQGPAGDVTEEPAGELSGELFGQPGRIRSHRHLGRMRQRATSLLTLPFSSPIAPTNGFTKESRHLAQNASAFSLSKYGIAFDHVAETP